MNNTAEIKIKIFREIDKLPEQYLPDLQVMIEKYVSKVQPRRKSIRKLGIMKDLILYMATDFNAPVEDFASYMN